MLILCRRPGQVIRIGEDITLTVLGVKGVNVRVGIDAPKDVRVDREEVRERLNRSTPKDPEPEGNR